MAKDTIETSGKKVEALYRDSHKWISTLQFTGDELDFIVKLLHSYVFEPNTPNLFERLQDYLSRLENAKREWTSLVKLIHSHECELGGVLESDSLPSDLDIERKHSDLAAMVEEYQGKFTMLKSEIFNYAGGILKRRKE